MRGLFARAAAVLLVAAGVTFAPAPVQAAACTDGGVTVVVDYRRAGGNSAVTSCVADGGNDSASSLFTAAGHELTRVQRQPGAVCKVDGLRSRDACVAMPPGNAFWGLFWSDGDGGWTFSQEGVDSLNVPDGGSVGWAWQDGGGYDYPGAPPATEPQQPAGGSDPSPSGGGSAGPSGGGGSSGPRTPVATPSAGATASPEADPSPAARRDGDRADDADPGRDRAGDRDDRKSGDREKRERTKREERRVDRARPAAGSEGETLDAPTGSAVTSDPADTSAEGLPVWVAPVAIGTLLLVAGGAAYLRRRSSGTA